VSAHWVVDPYKIITLLEKHGFDVEQSDVALPGGGGSLTARQEIGTEALLVKTDAGGRLQILLTEELENEAAEPVEIAGVRLTITDTTINRRTIRGTVTEIDQFREIIEYFDLMGDFREPPPV
jgi:hypothetical protein